LLGDGLGASQSWLAGAPPPVPTEELPTGPVAAEVLLDALAPLLDAAVVGATGSSSPQPTHATATNVVKQAQAIKDVR
jgi:hypothetical protein